jgi:hypothetical protein
MYSSVFRPELLAPVGVFEKMQIALRCGHPGCSQDTFVRQVREGIG